MTKRQVKELRKQVEAAWASKDLQEGAAMASDAIVDGLDGSMLVWWDERNGTILNRQYSKEADYYRALRRLDFQLLDKLDAEAAKENA